MLFSLPVFFYFPFTRSPVVVPALATNFIPACLGPLDTSSERRDITGARISDHISPIVEAVGWRSMNDLVTRRF